MGACHRGVQAGQPGQSQFVTGQSVYLLPTCTTATLADSPSSRPPVPVTLLSGFLGAGKSTLLQHILTNVEGLRVGVVVNDMERFNVDAIVPAAARSSGSNGGGRGSSGPMVQLANGCICCSLRTDLIRELEGLAARAPLTHIVVSATIRCVFLPCSLFDRDSCCFAVVAVEEARFHHYCAIHSLWLHCVCTVRRWSRVGFPSLDPSCRRF